MDRISLITLALAKKFTKSTVAALEQVVRYIGVTTTAISDGSTTNPITINGQSVTAVAGDTVFYNGTSYAWDGSAWQEVMNIAEIISAVEELGTKVHDILGDIAPEFNANDTYAVDDIVLYENDLYIFTSAHTGAWDSGDVSVTNIAQIVDDLRTEISAKQDALTFDNTPTASSTNPVTSDGIQKAITATAKTASGNPIVIQDAANVSAESLKLTVLPIQSLHGYDHPWVGGAEKNKLENKNITRTTGGITYTVQDDGSFIANRIGASSNLSVFTLTNSSNSLDKTQITPFKSGNTIIATSGVNGQPIKCRYADGTYATLDEDTEVTLSNDVAVIYVEFANTQNPSNIHFHPMIRVSGDNTWIPYANECPISGRTAVNVGSRGKNMAKFWKTGYINNAGAYVYDTSNAMSYPVFLKGGNTYTIKTNSGITILSFNGALFTGFDGTDLTGFISRILEPSTENNTITFTPSVDCWMVCSINLSYRIPSADNYETVYKVQIEDGATATEYEPYVTPSSILIQFGQTVYGCRINANTGAGEIIQAIKDFDDLSWSKIADSLPNSFKATISGKKNASSSSVVDNILCSCYKPVTGTEATTLDNVIGGSTGNSMVYVTDSAYTDADTFKTARTGQTICYELATPIPIQLSPALLTLLKGYNYITADGDMELSYQPDNNTGDIKSWTEQKINTASEALDASKVDNSVVGTVENGTTASRAYAVGEHFTRNEKFCTAIASIANGATLTLNTNYVEGTISDVINVVYYKESIVVTAESYTNPIGIPAISGYTPLHLTTSIDGSGSAANSEIYVYRNGTSKIPEAIRLRNKANTDYTWNLGICVTYVKSNTLSKIELS